MAVTFTSVCVGWLTFLLTNWLRANEKNKTRVKGGNIALGSTSDKGFSARKIQFTSVSIPEGFCHQWT